MTTLAIELNDAELRLARPEGVVGVEPGCAVLDGDSILTGTPALRAARLRPRQTYDRFWADLNTEPLAQKHPRAQSYADLAFAQLSSLWARYGTGIEEVVFIVPGSFRRDQLGLLLGIAEACGLPVRGLVDAAVASSHRPFAGRELAHIDAGLYGVVFTRLDQTRGVQRGTVETTSSVGLAALRERWLRSIGQSFLTQARFDPLHDAQAEQALFDQLPACLEALRARDTTRIQLEIRGRTHAAGLKRTDLSSATADLYASLVETLKRTHPSGTGLVLQVSHRLAALPGLLEVLATGATTPIPLEPEASCMGALARLDDIRAPAGRVSLVQQLAWSDPPRDDGA